MNIKGALREAEKRWGKRALVSDHRVASTPEARAAARQEVKAMRAAPVEPGTDRIARKRRLDELMGEARHYRYHVGQRMELLGAFHVMGSGDTWEEAFDAADKRR